MTTSHDIDAREYNDALWTSEELGFWHRVVAVYMGVLPELERDLQRAGRLSFFEYQVLEHLSSVDGAMSMTQLSTRCNSSLSRLSHVARKLEGRRLLTRQLSEEDKRVTVAELTAEGRKLVDRTREIYRQSVETRVLQSLSPDELRQVTGLLDSMLRKNEPNHWLFSY
ncbi:MarR family winged helix-turn-helix transcriptional regulator [Enteractinococcus coprophilus]|uniref:MarR family winged helix-turn-helix transcriptional regulator n=1 Tax=Enteractinococcus coprophilus TaxID=1027633 RepID=UPI001477749A|nr:MarR family transcriptional regulator [Enteractinococcus coprophilus]